MYDTLLRRHDHVGAASLTDQDPFSWAVFTTNPGRHVGAVVSGKHTLGDLLRWLQHQEVSARVGKSCGESSSGKHRKATSSDDSEFFAPDHHSQCAIDHRGLIELIRKMYLTPIKIIDEQDRLQFSGCDSFR